MRTMLLVLSQWWLSIKQSYYLVPRTCGIPHNEWRHQVVWLWSDHNECQHGILPPRWDGYVRIKRIFLPAGDIEMIDERVGDRPTRILPNECFRVPGKSTSKRNRYFVWKTIGPRQTQATMANRILPLELIDKAIGSQIWILMRGKTEVVGVLRGFDDYVSYMPMLRRCVLVSIVKLSLLLLRFVAWWLMLLLLLIQGESSSWRCYWVQPRPSWRQSTNSDRTQKWNFVKRQPNRNFGTRRKWPAWWFFGSGGGCSIEKNWLIWENVFRSLTNRASFSKKQLRWGLKNGKREKRGRAISKSGSWWQKIILSSNLSCTLPCFP